MKLNLEFNHYILLILGLFGFDTICIAIIEINLVPIPIPSIT